MKRLTAIDAARGVASVLVMLYHCNAVVQTPKYFNDQPFGGIFGLGGVRMPFFFAMSGFMLSMVHGSEIGRSDRVGRYLLSRFARIYPAYWVVLALTVPVYLLRPDFSAGTDTANLWTVLKSFLLWPQPGVPYLVVAWTLQSMVLFYLVFALAIWRPWLGGLVFSLWQLLVLGAVVRGVPMEFPASFLLQPLYFNFLLGGLAARTALRSKVARPLLWFWAGFGFLLLATALDFLRAMPLPFEWQLLINGVASAVMLVGLASWEMSAPAQLRVPRILLACGEASYGIFLVHYPLLSLLSKVGMAAGIGRWLSGEVIFLLFAAVCVAAGIGFSRWVEKPVTLWVQNRLGLARSRRLPTESRAADAAAGTGGIG